MEKPYPNNVKSGYLKQGTQLQPHCFFNDGWVPYEQRQDYLLDADIGITTYQDSLETHFHGGHDCWITSGPDCRWYATEETA